MATIDRIVDVNITLNTAGVSQREFDKILVLVPTALTGGGLVAIITEPDEALDLGVLANSQAYKDIQIAFSQEPRPSSLYLGYYNSAKSAAENMAGILAENDEWYLFKDSTNTSANVLALAAWAEANHRPFLYSSTDATAAAGTSTIADQLKAANYYYTFMSVMKDVANSHNLALMAKQFNTLPGGEDYANVTLAGVTADKWTETQAQNAFNRNVNTFEPFRDIALTQNGKVAAGEWFDTIRFRDWLVEDIKVEVLTTCIDRKIPFTDPGIQIIVQALRKSLDRGVQRGGIAPQSTDADGKKVYPSYTITFPRAVDVSTADKRARILRDIKFSATLANSIHNIVINGSLTYENMAAA